MTMTAPYCIQAVSDYSKAKICNACMAGTIYKNVWLAGYQYGVNTRFWRSAYSLEISMNDVAGMEMVKALGDIT